MEPLYIVDFTKPFNLFVDASGYATSAVLTQTDDNGKELPVAFSSTKLNATQSSWSTIEREAYAALLALKTHVSRRVTNKTPPARARTHVPRRVINKTPLACVATPT